MTQDDMFVVMYKILPTFADHPFSGGLQTKTILLSSFRKEGPRLKSWLV